MYRWSDEEGTIHIMDHGWLGPAKTTFGYSSLCEETIVAPREGVDFSLTSTANGTIECRECMANHSGDRFQEYAIHEGHCVGINRDEKGNIRVADLLCFDRSLQDELGFYLPEVTPDVAKSEPVCSDCWEAYELRDWGPNDWGGQIEVSVRTESGRQTYYADSLKAIPMGVDTVVELTSEKGFTRQFEREEIESISIQPTYQVNY